ncbi:MAG TPA: hypothetical protein VFB22_05400 [Candidatus Baltobacteraceae bacterium]|nr:hypothetical protein [Candidatus Baltobacteraceae bacterium]
MRMLILAAVTGAVALPAAALAQATPVPQPRAARPPMMMRHPDAAMPLRMAYRAIGMAEALGASGRYLDGARAHYRAAIAAAGTDARRAAGEARVAADLARVALAERPAPVPRDLPAPPSPKPRGGAPDGAMPDGAMPPDGDRRSGPGGPGGPRFGPGPDGFGARGGFGEPGGFGRRHGFAGGHGGGMSVVALAELSRNTQNAEVKQLVADALAAQTAAQHAAMSGNVEEAAREVRVSGALAHAARDLAFATRPAPPARRRPT